MHRLSFHGRKGFTLAELLVVVAVLALLATIVFVNLRGARDGAERSRAMRDAATSNRLLVCGQGQMMDLDGNLYRTVEIGGICWMAENLRYLPRVSPSTVVLETEPVYYVYNYQGTNVSAAKAHPNFQMYGVLYNWPAAMTACPPGTRLPTDEEFHILERAFTTGTCDPNRTQWPAVWDCHPAGTALKVSSAATPVAWDGNNLSGFMALPAGIRGNDYAFWNLSVFTYFWSSSESGVDAWARLLHSGMTPIYRWAHNKGFGFSVRCVR